ncbi:MAG: efflux RND transporter periplasmic adaptor subunit [Psychroflexus sp.]|nr:efflux RND transporter periplasmic adaptor subunit [Psychroflexus sp.]MDR9449298.1 efflux RND transporter periplasmic adaptor subunit [Psychroflexus sp.]
MKSIHLLYALFLISLIGCAEQSEKKEDETNKEQSFNEDLIQLTEKQFDNGDFELGRTRSTQISDKIRISGQVNVPPSFIHTVNAPFEGYVKNIDLIEGDVVQQGDVLFTLQDPSYLTFQENYVKNYNQLEYLRANYERKEKLLKDSIVSVQQYQKVKSSFKDMQSKVQADTERLRMMNLDPKKVLDGNLSGVIPITAAMSGTVENINIQGGSYLGMNKEAMRIINTDHIHLQLNALEKDIDQIHKEDTIDFQVPEVSRDEFKAEIIQISNVVNADKKVLIHAHPLKEIDFLKLGMFVEAYAKVGQQRSPGLPVTAFVESSGDSFVLQLVKQKDSNYYFKKVKVDTQKRDEGIQPILSKVDTTKQYLTKGGFDLL